MNSDAEIGRFVVDATAFLEAHASRRVTELSSWGDGSDRVPLLEQPDLEVGKHELADARRWRRLVFDAGFGWLGGPIEYGGAGRSPVLDDVFRDLEEEFDVPGRAFFGIARNILAPAILDHGTQVLKEKYLRSLFRGDIVACQLFSEPDAGSDLAGARTIARRMDDGWLVNGQKVWTSYAHLAQVGELLARTDPAAPKHHGLTMFVVDMESEGVDVRPLRQMSGGADFNEVFLNDVFVPDTHRIGEIGSGWSVARTTLTSERGSVGSGESTVASPLVNRLDGLLRYLDLQDDPLHRQALAQAHAADRVIHLLNEQTKLRENPGPFGSISKLLFSRQLERVANAASNLLGDRILADSEEWGTFAWSDFLLSAPGLRIAGGTDEIMLNIIGEALLGLPREVRAASEIQ